MSKPEEAQEVAKAPLQEEEPEYVFTKAANEFYSRDHVEKPIKDSLISRRNIRFNGVMGQQSLKRYNVHFLEDDVIIFLVGNKYQTYNLTTKEFKTFDGQDTDGVGSIAVHKDRQYFAVAEKGVMPNIYIWEYPTFKLYRILRKGTELSYAHCEFSNSGEKMVSLGGAPDYTLTVWDWARERVVLKCKAFGQEVFKASFSPFSDDILFTGGSGHIKFWKLAQTFTGLKLQGEIAKYGQLELSDAPGFHELPDGKIVSGTEYGTMILWEGNLVKAHLVLDREAKTPLHNGAIETILFEDEQFITAGSDGFIKWWSLTDIDNAEADEIAEVAIVPTKEVSVKTEDGDYAHIMNMVKGNGIWLIQDAKGRLWQLSCDDYTSKVLLNYHSGSINDLALSDAYNMAVTAGQDGTVKVWDYSRNKEYYSKKFLGKSSCTDIIRRSELNKGRVVVVGFDTGVVRILQLSDIGIELAMAFKAHDGPVVFTKFAPNQISLVTASRNGEIFFFDVNGHLDLGKYTPICLLQLPKEALINDLKWDSQGSKILVACENGYVYEIQRPDPTKVKCTDSYLIEDYPMRAWKIKMMEFQMKRNQKKDEEEEEKKRRARLRGELKEDDQEEEEDWEPDSILKVCYTNEDKGEFMFGTKGQYKGFYYLASFDQMRPTRAIPISEDYFASVLQSSTQGDLIIMGFTNGEIRLLNMANPDKFMVIKQHDAHGGGIKSAKFSFDERCIISAGAEGLVFVHVLDKYMILQESKFNPIAGVEGIDFMPQAQVQEVIEEKTKKFQQDNEPNLPEIDPSVDGLDEILFSVSLRGLPENQPDIEDHNIYSIQQSKLRTEEDRRLELAEEKKQGVRKKIDQLRQEFTQLVKQNEVEEEVIRVSQNDFNIDPEYFEMLLERNASKIEETKKEVAWNIEYHTVRLNKLKNKFYDVLDFEKFTVKAMRTSSYVTTFRVPKMSDFLQKNIEQFKQLLEQEIAAKENMDFDDDDEPHEEQHAEVAQKVDVKKVAVVSKVNQTEAEKKREERKVQRELRKKKIEKLKKKEAMINGNEEPDKNPQIIEARATYGMFNLKMSHDYEVPENQQINFSKKRQQMVLLEGSIHKLKVDFNTKIQDLKQRKKDIIASVSQMNVRLAQINTVLATPEELFLPSIDEKTEYPQKFFDINDQEIEDFRELKKQRELDAAASKKGGKKKKGDDKDGPAKKNDDNNEVKNNDAPKNEKNTHTNPYLNQVAERKGAKKMESELDDEYTQIMRIELQFEKSQLRGDVDTLIDDFDTDIKEMQKEKYRLESDLKNAEIKLILLFEELILLKSMEEKDHDLSHQLASCRQEKGLIMKEINEITKKLREKRKEIDNIKNEEDVLMVKFHEYCPEGSPKYDELRKFYERITKKRRKAEKIEKENEDDDEEEGEQEKEEEPEEADEDEDDPAITGLSQEDFKIDEIEKLRDERLQLYDSKEKIGLYINELEQQRKRMETTEKRINTELTETEEEIKDFQKEKMAKLNQLDVSVVLKIKQIQNLMADGEKVAQWLDIRQNQLNQRLQEIREDEELGGDEKEQLLEETQKQALAEEDYRGFFLPRELKDSVLFTRAQLLQLIDRKRELDEEITGLRKQQAEARAQEVQKRKEINENKKQRNEKEREYNERQMLRFGNLIDLDSLEVSGPSQAVLDKQNEFHKTEKKCIRDIEEKEADFQKTQRDLTECIQKNTNLLNLIRTLGEEQLELNRKLDSTNKAIFVDEDNEEKRKMKELKEHFKQKLEMQAKEIDILKTEINLYKRKGGHIYTKVTTNRRVAHLNNEN